MAHSAVVIDQFVVLFGGYNKVTNSLISNDLYILCLNGISNALLPKEKAPEKRILPKAKPGKPASKESPTLPQNALTAATLPTQAAEQVQTAEATSTAATAKPTEETKGPSSSH